MEKQIVIINGQGGVGKDTVCNILKKYYQVRIVSAIDKIKEIASYGGWDGQKDLKGRKLLSDIKMAFCKYNDLPYKEMVQEIDSFFANENEQILFIHVREPQEIHKLVAKYPMIKTLLIKRGTTSGEFGNVSDDNVQNYDYDFVFDNNKGLDELEKDFVSFFENKMIK